MDDIAERVLNMLIVARINGAVNVTLPHDLQQRHGQKLQNGKIFVRGRVKAVVELVIKVKAHRQKVLVQLSSEKYDAQTLLDHINRHCNLGSDKIFHQRKFMSDIVRDFKPLEVDTNPDAIITEEGFVEAARRAASEAVTASATQSSSVAPAAEEHTEKTEPSEPSFTEATVFILALCHFMGKASDDEPSEEDDFQEEEREAVREEHRLPSAGQLRRMELDDLLYLGIEQAVIVEDAQADLDILLAEIKTRNVCAR